MDTAMNEAITLYAKSVLDVSPCLPWAADCDIYFREGRRYVRVFWTYKGVDAGSILFFVEKTNGRVWNAKSSKTVGTRVIANLDFCS